MRSLKLYTSPRAALWSLLPLAALLYLQTRMPFSGLYLGMMMLLAMPFVLQIILTVAGLAPAALALVLCAGAMQLSVGPMGTLAALIYLLPPIAAYVICLELKLHWPKAMLLIGASLALATLLLFLYARQSLGADPFAALTRSATEAMESLPERDYFLDSLYRLGFLQLPDQIAASPLVPKDGGGYTFSEAALAEFYKQLSLRLDLWFRALLPTLVSSFSVWLGVAGLYISTHYGKRHAQRLAFRGPEGLKQESVFTGISLPDFAKWHIPKPQGFLLFACGGIYLLTRLSPGGSLSLAGQMLYQLFAAFFSIQGLSLINHLQKRGNSRPFMRVLSMIGLLLILPQAAVLIGVYDQLTDARKLRGTKDKQDNSDRRMDI